MAIYGQPPEINIHLLFVILFLFFFQMRFHQHYNQETASIGIVSRRIGIFSLWVALNFIFNFTFFFFIFIFTYI